MKELSPDRIKKDVLRSVRTADTFDEYTMRLGLSISARELVGKRILDIGAGDSDFAQRLMQKGKKTQVVRLDPAYAIDPPEERRNTIVGVAQWLPFQNESFDEVLAMKSLIWVRTGMQQTLTEMLRVTKQSGTIRICPSIPKFRKNESDLDRSIRLFTSDNAFYTTIITKPHLVEADYDTYAQHILSVINFRPKLLLIGNAFLTRGKNGENLTRLDSEHKI
jgi:ubiquinone/menaquinone biosynthesis C-methylase UbiE